MKAGRPVGLARLLPSLLSGPPIAAFVLLVPFGLVTMAIAVFDPKLTVYRQIGIWTFLVPWTALSVLVSAVNARSAYLRFADPGAGRAFRIRTDRFADDASGAENVNDMPGKAFVEAFAGYLARTGRGDLAGEPVAEDYGWGMGSRVGEARAWLAFSFADRDDANGIDEYVVSAVPVVGIRRWPEGLRSPWDLRDALEAAMREYLLAEGIAFEEEVG